MSIGTNTLHVLYLGQDSGPVAELPGWDGVDAAFLVTHVPDAGLATAQLTRGEFDCVVCDGRLLDPDVRTFLRRLSDRSEAPPVVVRADDEASVPSDLYDAATASATAGDLAPLLLDVAAGASSAADGTTGASPPVADDPEAGLLERALQEERAFLETVIDSLADVFFVLDPEFRLVRWNDTVNELTGRSDESLRGADPLEFIDGARADEARERLGEVVTEGHATAELDVAVEGGESVPYEFTASLVRGEDGAPRYICGIGRDVAERRETEAELERSNAELEQFAYVASHDLKEPLRMVSSYLQLLERRYGDELDEDGREFVEFAVDGARRMQEMIDDLLEYSRVGRRDGEFEPVDCEDVLDSVRRNLQVAIDDADATVEVGDLPTVVGDRSRLVELFQNLVSNAIKYAGDEPPVVEVTATREGGRWVVAVADEGIGIPEERIDRVFDLFYRTDVHDSTGIGLALAKKIVESHGGDIRVESTPGEGSTFYVSLPANES